jgi:hypothetical protein
MAEDKNPNPPLPALGTLRIEHEREYVAGFPVHVAITVVGDPRWNLTRLPLLDFRALSGCIGLVLRDPTSGKTVFEREARPVVDEESTMAFVDLDPGQECRMLIDLSELLAEGPPVPDAGATWSARVTYAARAHFPAMRRDADLVLRIRKPTSLEAHVLASLAPELDRAATWGEWATARPTDPREAPLLTSRVDARDPLRYLRLVRYVLFSSTELAAMDLRDFAVLDGGVYGPDADALRAELLAARGDIAGRDALFAKLRAQTPGMFPQIADIEANATYVGWVRARTKKMKGRPVATP